MRRRRFLGYGGVAVLSACSGGLKTVPSLAGGSSPAQTAPIDMTRSVLPASALPAAPLMGTLRRFDGSAIPAGWMVCDGRILNIADYPKLFAIIGTIGGGDGKKTFGLPKMRAFQFVMSVAGATPSTPAQLALLNGSPAAVNAPSAAAVATPTPTPTASP